MDNPILEQLLSALKSHPLLGLLFNNNKDVQPKTGQHTEIIPFKPAGTPYAAGVAEMSEGRDAKLFAKLFGAAQRPEGIRFYSGEGSGSNEDQAINQAQIGLEHKLLANPSDSLRTDDARKAMGSEWGRVLEMLRRNPDYANTTVY